MSQRIGLFDSGVGGLTVVRALLNRFPQLEIEYVADQAHVPYGGRPLEEVRGFAQGISRYLAERRCDAVVMACNISSATALDAVAAELAPLPVLGMIRPAAQRAFECYSVSQTGNNLAHIGVLATEGTVATRAYTQEIVAQSPCALVTEVACPKFVPLVESGRQHSEEAVRAAREYLAPLAKAGCSTIVLGCTHYPYLLDALGQAAEGLFPGSVQFIDPAEEIAGALESRLGDIRAGESRPAQMMSSGDLELFGGQVERFLPGVPVVTNHVSWQGDRLVVGEPPVQDSAPKQLVSVHRDV